VVILGNLKRSNAFGVKPQRHAAPFVPVARPLGDFVGQFGEARNEHGVVKLHQVPRVQQRQRFKLRRIRLGVTSRVFNELLEALNERSPRVDQLPGIVEVSKVGGPQCRILDNPFERLGVRVVVDGGHFTNLAGLHHSWSYACDAYRLFSANNAKLRA
jgi:hypothetical protein